MRIILPGYEGSKKILAASSYLINKYIPKEFDVYWLNYGLYTGRLFSGTYVSLDEKQYGGSGAWSMYLMDYIKTLTDKYVILGLDDYFIDAPMNIESYKELLGQMDDGYICARLSSNKEFVYKHKFGDHVQIASDKYTCTAQYCIWDREKLLEILKDVRTPWEFEVWGTEIMNRLKYYTIGSLTPPLQYPDHSVLSNKWVGCNTLGNSEENIKELKQRGYI